MYHYGPNGHFDAYYVDQALAIEAGLEASRERRPVEERAEMIVVPQVMSAIAGASVFLSALIILVHVVG